MGQQRAAATAARETEPLAAAGQACFEIAAERSREVQIAVGVFVPESPELEKPVHAGRRQRQNPVGQAELLQQRQELRPGQEGDCSVGARSADRAEQRNRHDHVAKPVRQADPKAGLAGYGGEAACGDVGRQQVASGLEAQPPRGNVLVPPSIMRPQPGGAGVIAAGEAGFQPAVQREGHAAGGTVVNNGVGAQFRAPKSEAAGIDCKQPGPVFLSQHPGELARRAHPAEQGAERPVDAGVLVEQQGDAAAPLKDLHRLVKPRFARKHAHAETFAGPLYPCIRRGVVERAENGADLDAGLGGNEWNRSLRFPAAKVHCGAQQRARISGPIRAVGRPMRGHGGIEGG